MSNLGVLSRLSALFECANFLPLLAPTASCVDRFALEEDLDADALLPPSSHPFGSRLTAGEGGWIAPASILTASKSNLAPLTRFNTLFGLLSRLEGVLPSSLPEGMVDDEELALLVG